ncbi:hypothetical protein B0H13DRAFT_1941097 [Mycena leptocephala]|nr:hypothetical protein B0H13DRAFT_1941097 [Mycena leptocephala]
MTDYNLTEEYKRGRDALARVSEWTQNIHRVPQADPFTPPTPVRGPETPLPSTSRRKASRPPSINSSRHPPLRETGPSAAPQTGVYGVRSGPQVFPSPSHPFLFVNGEFRPPPGWRSQAPRLPRWDNRSVTQAPQMQSVGPHFHSSAQGQNGYVYPFLFPSVYGPVVYRLEPIPEQSPYSKHARSTKFSFLKRLLARMGWFRRRSRGTNEGVTRQ